jgi:hypothetical protein
MPKKPNEARSHLSMEGGVSPAPVRRSRTPRAKAAAASASNGNAEHESSRIAVETAPAFSSEPNYSPSDYEEIARLAYYLWEARGGQGGSPEEDWFNAEQEYRKRVTVSSR